MGKLVFVIRRVSCFLGVLSVVGAGCGPKLGGTGDGTGTSGVSGTSGGGGETGTPTGGVTGEPGTSSTSALSGASSSSGEGCESGCMPDIPDVPCDPYAQDCPEGEKCGVAWPDGIDGGTRVNLCVPVTGDGKPGEPCTYLDEKGGVDDCVEGAICWGDKCVSQCVGSFAIPICAEEDYRCTIAQDGSLDLCFFVCDPLQQNCPDPTEACYPSNGAFVCAPDNSGDQGQANDPCEFLNECAEGLVCIDPVAASAACALETFGCCQPFCSFPDAPCPNPDQVCVQWLDPMSLPPGDPQLEIGVCLIPQ